MISNAHKDNLFVWSIARGDVREARKDIAVLSDRLSHSSFIAGNGLSVYDFSVAAHLASILYWELDNWLADLFREDKFFINIWIELPMQLAGLSLGPSNSRSGCTAYFRPRRGESNGTHWIDEKELRS